MGNIRNHSGFQTFVNDRSVALSPAHQKQGPFPPPTLLGLYGIPFCTRESKKLDEIIASIWKAEN
jgi:hypothetical protein